MSRARHDEAVGLRIKAAMVLTGKEMQDVIPVLAAALEVSPRTVGRMTAGTRPLDEAELATVADRLDVPLSFLRDGFSRSHEGDSVAETTAAVEVVSALLEALVVQPDELRRLVAVVEHSGAAPPE